MNTQKIKDIRKLRYGYIIDAQRAREAHEWASFYILMDKANLLEWVLGERKKP